MVLQGGYRLTDREIGRLTPGQILSMIVSDRAYAHNQASLIAFHIRQGMGLTRRAG